MEASECVRPGLLPAYRSHLASRHQTSSSQHLITSSTNCRRVCFEGFKRVQSSARHRVVTVTLPASFFVLDTKEKVPERWEQVRERSARSDEQED